MSERLKSFRISTPVYILAVGTAALFTASALILWLAIPWLQSGQSALSGWVMDASVFFIVVEGVVIIGAMGVIAARRWRVAEKEIALRKEVEGQLAAREEQFRYLTEATPDTHFRLDPEGTVTYLSPQIRNYGRNPDDLVGYPLTDIILEEDRDLVVSQFREFLRSGTSTSIQFRIADRGTVYWLEEHSTVLRDEKGRVTGIYGILRDVTERKHAEEAREEMNRKLHLLSQITRHDILNRVMAAECYLRLARDTATEEGDRYLSKLEKAVDDIERYLAFTRDYQELGAGPPVWQDLFAAVTSSIEAADLPDEVVVSVELPQVEVWADPMLERALFNLIQNSVNHAVGMTRLSVLSVIDENTLRVIVQDNGPGIPKDDKLAIFRQTWHRRHGHGLFLVREILDLTAITITETGVPGEGARFEIIVPPGAWRYAPGEADTS